MVGPRQPLLDRGAAVGRRPQALLEAGDERAERGLVGGPVVPLRGLVGDTAGEQVAQLADPGVARGDAVAQMVLLAQELFAQGRVLRLELAQPADVGPIGRTYQVGKHVDFAEDVADQRVVGGRMGERRPIAARNIALLDGVAP